MNALGVVAEAIAANGPLSFSRFMDVALYDPAVGFYVRGGSGRRRDFITSPEVGPLFGAVVARALDSWWHALDRPHEFVVVDAGAGPGTLARAVLKAEPACASALRYIAVETSPGLRDNHPTWVESVAQMPPKVDVGVILANELLDNIPFDIVEFQPDRGWFDVVVDIENDRLVHRFVEADPARFAGVDEPRDRRRMPVQGRAQEWLSGALASLGHGRLVVIDYAVPAYPTEADRSWLRTYAAHQRGLDPLEHVGECDITADVDLEALSAVAEPAAVSTQAQWLTLHGIDALVAEGQAYWTQHAAAPDLAAMAMRSRGGEAEALLDPDGLGGFTVAEWDRPPGR